jgi:uncharacterized protein
MSVKQQERRAIVGAEIRASQGEFVIQARALTYGALSQPGVPFAGARERIAPGAFQASLDAGVEILALVNHDTSQILGRTRNGTLVLADDASCLRFRVTLNKDVSAHRDLHALVKAGTLSECSFGFVCDDDTWAEQVDEQGQRYQLRTVTRATLMDVSVVAAPAYANGATDAQARALRYVNGGNNVAAEQLARRLEAMPGDWARKEKLQRIGLEILASDRRAETQTVWPEGVLDLCQASLDDFYGPRYRVIGVKPSDELGGVVYGFDLRPDDDTQEDDALRWSYQVINGKLILDNASRQVFKLQDVPANPRSFAAALAERRERKAEYGKHMRACALTGITCRNGF